MCTLFLQKSQKAGREYTNIKYSTEAVGGGDVKTALSKTQLSTPGVNSVPGSVPGTPGQAVPNATSQQPRTPTLSSRRAAPPK